MFAIHRPLGLRCFRDTISRSYLPRTRLYTILSSSTRLNRSKKVPSLGSGVPGLSQEGLAAERFLSHLESTYDALTLSHPTLWLCVAAIAFSGLNHPEAVPWIYQHAVQKENMDQRLMARKMKDALFKASVLFGIPKALNGMAALQEVLPPELQDEKPLRKNPTSPANLAALHKAGQAFFSQLYGEITPTEQPFLVDSYPDLGGPFYMTTIIYGYVYSFTDYLDAAETSLCIVAALIASGSPKRQYDNHVAGALRNKASRSELEAVQQVVSAVVHRCTSARKAPIERY
ncbi:hypothetical protein V5O48_004935 [Marasmius crinis-equi]|uniref:Carboxymuconolactone decarboxylase-like domain-containing protein n=1 Tax=Marasmius crinis-equi TaxID=585013 RepID=A0ABR3FPF7_9AGAR